mmetsp:Transcript_63144/g.137267  ORF Transcript_63144/g.137267 Transcript_63144/m.137267 type:complete len:205 (+) Transcript_63144:1275-1889(+)
MSSLSSRGVLVEEARSVGLAEDDMSGLGHSARSPPNLLCLASGLLLCPLWTLLECNKSKALVSMGPPASAATAASVGEVRRGLGADGDETGSRLPLSSTGDSQSEVPHPATVSSSLAKVMLPCARLSSDMMALHSSEQGTPPGELPGRDAEGEGGAASVGAAAAPFSGTAEGQSGEGAKTGLCGVAPAAAASRVAAAAEFASGP